MRYTIRNVQPSVLFIPDAGLRLKAGQTAIVGALTPQMGALLVIHALEVVAKDVPAAVPVVTPTVSDEPTPAAFSVPEDHSPEAKRSGRKAAAPLVTLETHDDAQ